MCSRDRRTRLTGSFVRMIASAACLAALAPPQSQAQAPDPRVTACIQRGGSPQACAAAVAPRPAPAPAPTAPANTPAPVPGNCVAADADWKEADRQSTLAAYQRHLVLFPACVSAPLARARIAAIESAPRPWLGVGLVDVTSDLVTAWKLPPQGVAVVGVNDYSPAYTAGISAGDVIIRFDGRDVTKAEELIALIRGNAPGRSVEVVVRRAGVDETKTITLGTWDCGAADLAAVQAALAEYNEALEKLNQSLTLPGPWICPVFERSIEAATNLQAIATARPRTCTSTSLSALKPRIDLPFYEICHVPVPAEAE